MRGEERGEREMRWGHTLRVALVNQERSFSPTKIFTEVQNS